MSLMRNNVGGFPGRDALPVMVLKMQLLEQVLPV